MRYYFFIFVCNFLLAVEVPKSLTVFEHLHLRYTDKLLKDERFEFDKVFNEWIKGIDSLLAEKKLVEALHTIKSERKRKKRSNTALPTKYNFLELQIDKTYKMIQFLHLRGFIKMRDANYYEWGKMRAKNLNSIFPLTLYNQEDKCPVCIDEICNVEMKKCKHAFCKKCITKWVKENYTCPMCRGIIKRFENFQTFKDVSRVLTVDPRVLKSRENFVLICKTYRRAHNDKDEKKERALLRRHNLDKKTAEFLFKRSKRPFLTS